MATCMAQVAITIDRITQVSRMTRTDASLLRTLWGASGWIVVTTLVGQVPFVLNDTTFLQRDLDVQGYHAVYIVPGSDGGVSMVNDLVTLTPEGDKLVAYQLEDLRTTLAAHCPAERPPLPEAWVPVYPLNGGFYTYSPCDNGNNAGILLREGHVVRQTMEGPEVALEKVLEATDDGRCTMRWFTVDEPRGTMVTVHPVDKGTGLCLWTYFVATNEHYLMIPANKAHRLPRVVNLCTDRKWAEFAFDPVDPAMFR